MTPRDVAWWIDWLSNRALPLWADAGHDFADGSFVERLGLDGAPLCAVPRRVMVQARQVHVYVVAAHNRWFAGADALAVRAGDTMIARYGDGDGRNGWAFAARGDGTVTDARRDLYAQAFVLLALAGLLTIDRRPTYRRIVRQTLRFLDRSMADAAGGYVEQLPVNDLPRRQNPHMHLLEAYLALQAGGACGDLGDRIAAIIDLFDRVFLPPGATALAEYYGPTWARIGAPDAFEPGHHFEWIWLLDRHAALCGGSVPSRIDRLLPPALRGIDAAGRVVEGMGGAGPAVPSCRLWAMMEAAKALALPPASAALPTALEVTLEAAWRTFLAPAIPGGWVDRVDADGAPLVDHIPASSLYHICTSVDFLYRQSKAGKTIPRLTAHTFPEKRKT